jgi:Reverse transcriptase (RNA-dependent DNA polymerase)
MQTGIPQGSPLSPVLFSLFTSDLHEMFNSDSSSILSLGFSDDTNLLIWGPTASGNCRRLEAAHERCVAWARRGGGKFTPDKYQLIHFTRRRNADVQAVVRIEGFNGEPVNSLRVLGVWVDRKLKWTAHVQEATRKGAAQFEAMSRVVSSTWGPSFNKSRLLYTAVVRPTMTYGCKIWATGEKGGPPPASHLQPLVRLQNKCLRRVTGAYKRAPVKTLEKDAAVEPLPLHMQGIAMQHALRSEAHPVTGFIKRTCDGLWSRHQPRRGRRPRRPLTPMENLLSQAKATARDATETRSRRHNRRRRGRQREAGDQQGQRTRTAKELMSAWQKSKWKEQWLLASRGKQAPAWQTPWDTQVPKLHASLNRAQSTMATLLRTEAIGLNDFLHRVGVPNIEARCTCGWERQTPKHVVMSCPDLIGRDRMLAAAGTMDYTTLLNTEKGLKAVTSWLLRQGILPQFRVAKEMSEEDRSGWRPLTPLRL